MRLAQRVLAREHLALRAVARVVAFEARMLQEGKPVDGGLLQSIVDYVTEFPDRIHHPKEEDHLFARMRARNAQLCAPVLDKLLDEHQKEAVHIAELGRALKAFQAGIDGARARLAELAGSYAFFLDRHIDLENLEAFPLAEKVLTEEDWAAIDAAFAENDDPLAGGKDEKQRFAELHRRILALGAPPPGL